MVHIWVYSIVSVIIVSLISLIGIITLSLGKKTLDRMIIYMVSFSAGALFGDAFLHLLPEITKEVGFTSFIGISVLIGILSFFILEKYIHWRHCHVYGICDVHDRDKHGHSLAWINLFGDGLHNFIDGVIIAASYLVSIPIGIATTVAIIFHEIPQEIGDFGVLLHGGFSKSKAILFNFIISLTAIAGVIIALLLNAYVQNVTVFFIPFAAGGFLYIAGSDLIPELHKEVDAKKSSLQALWFVFGILVLYGLLFVG